MTTSASQKFQFIKKLISVCIIAAFSMTTLIPPQSVSAQNIPTLLNLPTPGTMLALSPGYTPTIVRGLTINPDNPLQFDFIIDPADEKLTGEAFRLESTKLVKYFLAALTVPENEQWVNLSPHEKNRIVPDSLGVTDMGRDLLAQDYLLKQMTASLVYPEDDLGSSFWQNIYKKAQELYGTTDIPVNTFNKVWIVPNKATVYEHEGSVFVVENHLKVMLEEDYVALEHNSLQTTESSDQTSTISSEMIRDLIIPELEKEINEGKNFATLRQLYNSMLLATWYKRNLKESLLGQVYAEQNKVKGIDIEDVNVKEKIYQQYLEAYEKGVFDFIREDYDSANQEVVLRKYFSGGAVSYGSSAIRKVNSGSKPSLLRAAIMKINKFSDIKRVSVGLAEPEELNEGAVNDPIWAKDFKSVETPLNNDQPIENNVISLEDARIQRSLKNVGEEKLFRLYDALRKERHVPPLPRTATRKFLASAIFLTGVNITVALLSNDELISSLPEVQPSWVVSSVPGRFNVIGNNPYKDLEGSVYEPNTAVYQRVILDLTNKGFTQEEAKAIIEETQRIVDFYNPRQHEHVLEYILSVVKQRNLYLYLVVIKGNATWEGVRLIPSEGMGGMEKFRALIAHEVAHLLFEPGYFRDYFGVNPHIAVYAMGYLRLLEMGRPDLLGTFFTRLQEWRHIESRAGIKLAKLAFALEQQQTGEGWRFLGEWAKNRRALNEIRANEQKLYDSGMDSLYKFKDALLSTTLISLFWLYGKARRRGRAISQVKKIQAPFNPSKAKLIPMPMSVGAI